MSKERAKKLLVELQTNEELKAQIAGIPGPAEMVKKAVEAGYDVTLEELTEAEKAFRAEMAKKSDELTADELEGAAGGGLWTSEEAKDGHEFDCSISYHQYSYQKENGEWCKSASWCEKNNHVWKDKVVSSGGNRVRQI